MQITCNTCRLQFSTISQRDLSVVWVVQIGIWCSNSIIRHTNNRILIFTQYISITHTASLHSQRLNYKVYLTLKFGYRSVFLKNR